MELSILLTYDYGVQNHTCDTGSSSSGVFVDAQELIDYCLDYIQQAYQEGSDLYVDANTCVHGYRVKFIIMEVVRFVANPEDDEDPRVVMFDIFNHHITYDQMVQNFHGAQEGVQKTTDLFN